MSSSAVPAPTRTRRACEPCRRKKTRCPGERPTCSFCRRLNQRCSYGDGLQDYTSASISKDRNTAPALVTSRSKRSGSRDRLQRLESHVEQIYGLLNNIGDTVPHSARTSSASNHTRTNSYLASPLTNDLEVSETFRPDGGTISNAIRIYNKKLHCQPLPLFRVDTLASTIREWPQHLLLSFIALTSRCSPSSIQMEQDSAWYQQKARRELMVQITKNDGVLDTILSLCLLILGEIADSDTIAAWTDIGIGARLIISNRKTASAVQTDDWSRACWSLFALDRIYGTSFSMVHAFPNEDGLPDYPQSHPIPQIKHLSTSFEQRQTGGSAQAEDAANIGIDSCCLRLFSVWGHTMSFLQSVRDSDYATIWQENGPYQKIVAKLYGFETSIGHAHRVRNAKLEQRSSTEIESDRAYWTPWFTMQILCHTLQILVNHPFLHLAKIRKENTMRPPSFLQRTVDQALLHSGWVINFINLCHEKNFEINDPFIAHLVAITATGYLFFFNSSNSHLALQANQGFNTCYRYIAHSATIWKHLKNTLHKLDILKKSRDDQSSSTRSAPGLSVQASLLWTLLDYSLSTTPTSVNDSSPATVELNVTTQFLSPLNSIPTSRDNYQQESECTPIISAVSQSDATPRIEPGLTAFDNDTSIFDWSSIGEIHVSNLVGDFWSEFGQL